MRLIRSRSGWYRLLGVWVLACVLGFSAREAGALDGLEPLSADEADGNVGVFIGIGHFERQAGLLGPPNDAVALAHVFVNELKLIPPKRAFVVYEGELSEESVRQAAALRQAGVSVNASGRKADVLRAIDEASGLSHGPKSLLVLTASTHGCELDGVPYILPSEDGQLINLSTEVRDRLKRFSEGRQIVISDACRSRPARSPATRAVGAPATRGELTKEALGVLKADVLVGACAPGQVSLDAPEFRMGLFSKTLVEALRGQAVVPGTEFVTLGQVLSYVSAQAAKQAGEMVRRNPQSAVLANMVKEYGLPRPWFEGELSALNLPLAKTKGGTVLLAAQSSKTESVSSRLSESVRQQGNLFSAADRAAVARLLAALSEPGGRDYSSLIAELDLILNPAEGRKPREVVELVRRFAEREDHRARLSALLAKMREEMTNLDASERKGLQRLREAVEVQMPPAAEVLFAELDRRFAATDTGKPREGLKWWLGWERERRRTALLEQLARANALCGTAVENRMAAYLDLRQRLKAEEPPKLDALLDELEMRLDVRSCTFLEATLEWWVDYRLAERRVAAVQSLSQARAAHPLIVQTNLEAFQRLLEVVKRTSPLQAEALLKEVEPRLSASNEAAGFQSMLLWWIDLERRERRAAALETIKTMLEHSEKDSPSTAPLVQLSGALVNGKPPRLDQILDEVEKRLDAFDPESLGRTCAWWSSFHFRERRDGALASLQKARERVPASQTEPRDGCQQLIQALGTLSQSDAEPILDQIERFLAPEDPATLRSILDWYDRRDPKKRALRLLTRAAAAYPDVTRSHAELYQRLTKALGPSSGSVDDGLLAEIEKRLSSSADAASLEGLFDWQLAIERQKRQSAAAATVGRVLEGGSLDATATKNLTQLRTALLASKPPHLDQLLDEVEKRFNPSDASSISQTCAWWNSFHLGQRREGALTLLAEAKRHAAATPGVSKGVFQQLTNALATLPQVEMEPLLDEIEKRLSPQDPATFGGVLGWYEKSFLRAPAWSLLVTQPAGMAQGKRATELADLMVRQLKSKYATAKISSLKNSVETPEESAITPLCRQFGAKAILILKVTNQEAREEQSSLLGRVVVAEAGLEITIIRAGLAVNPRAFSGAYTDVASRKDAAIKTALEKAIQQALSDQELSADLGL